MWLIRWEVLQWAGNRKYIGGKNRKAALLICMFIYAFIFHLEFCDRYIYIYIHTHTHMNMW